MNEAVFVLIIVILAIGIALISSKLFSLMMHWATYIPESEKEKDKEEEEENHNGAD